MTTQKTKTYDLENDDLENDDLESDDLENYDLENNDLENDDLENDDLENGDLENDDLENNDLENDDLKKNRGEGGGGGELIEVCEMPHPRTKPKQHIHSKCNLIKRAKHPRKSLIAVSYPGLIISNAKVNRSNVHVQHTFLHIVVRADNSL